MSRRPHFLQALVKGDPRDLGLFASGRPAPIATMLEPAFDSATRNRGLLGRNGLAPGAALVIAPSNAVHTFAMKFAIDLIFAARDGRVVKITSAVAPRRIALAFGAFAVIEMAAGQVAESGLRVGDVLEIRTSKRS